MSEKDPLLKSGTYPIVGHSAAVHTSKNKPIDWRVDLGERGVWLRFTDRNGKLHEVLFGADEADRCAGAMHAAAVERRRMVTMQKGEHVGRIQ